ncbi:ankyrin repeat domain-containing protein 16-like [Sitophilus oryzae]|uniref:Ankyrin repeat domain-containing protein 16-like n=1 Tax=Sitophilus oryzae TaxID=7048 RepID=A0A6J2XY35_SITOR|nr:ankyrin repeat domain-containing protein 16-like [Sitophilus oryzae]
MDKVGLDKRIRDKVLLEIQHNNLTSLKKLKSENPLFHWNHICYEKTGDSLLHVASRLGYQEIIDYLLSDEFGTSCVDIKNKDDKTPLHEATQFGQLASVLKLCSYGADVNALRRGDWTPLMLACTKIQDDISLQIVQTLFRNGALINIRNKDGWSCAHMLAREGSIEILEFLISRGLDVSINTKNGRSPLHIASLHGHIGISSLLLKYIDINLKDNCGNTPLHEAVLGQHIDLCKFLIKNGANICARNNSDFSLLHLAASKAQNNIIKYILNELKFDINDQNRNGWTSLHCAAKQSNKEAYKYLEKNGANVDIKDNYGRTAFDYL